MIDVLDALGDGLVDKKLVDIGAKPMGIRYGVMWAGRNEQLTPTFGRRSPGLASLMVKETETSFEATAKFRVLFLPKTPFCQRQQAGEFIAKGQLFQREIRQWRRRFADRETRMLPLFNQND